MRSQSFHTASAALLTPLLIGGALSIGALIMLAFSFPVYRVPPQASFPGRVVLNPDSIMAKSAILYDPQDGRVLFAKNANQSLALASLTKLMTAQVILKNESPQAMVQIIPEDLAPGGDWDGGLKPGESISINSLLTIGLIASSNDAMMAAVGSVPNYLDKMNTMAQTMGLSKTYFLDPTGLDLDDNTSGAYGSAYDIARLATSFFTQYPQYFELTQQSSVSVDRQGKILSATATAAPLLSVPGFIAAKTGYTDLAGGNLVAIFDVEIGHPLVAVVLDSTEKGRFADTMALIQAARNAEEQ